METIAEQVKGILEQALEWQSETNVFCKECLFCMSFHIEGCRAWKHQHSKTMIDIAEVKNAAFSSPSFEKELVRLKLSLHGPTQEKKRDNTEHLNNIEFHTLVQT